MQMGYKIALKNMHREYKKRIQKLHGISVDLDTKLHRKSVMI